MKYLEINFEEDEKTDVLESIPPTRQIEHLDEEVSNTPIQLEFDFEST